MKKVTDEVVEKAVQETPVKKTVAKKTVVKKAVATKTTENKPVVEEKASEKKAVSEKPVTEKKTTTRKKKEIVEEVYVQFSNNEVVAANVVEKVKAAYVAEGHTLDSVEKIRVYIKPEENMIYYVVNDDYASGIDLL